jgi:6-phosphogluconolactonase (cycloisomerase 2 family)
MISRTKRDAHLSINLPRIGRWLLAAVLMLPAGRAMAELAQPDFVFYGTATWFGEPLADGPEISLKVTSQGLVVAVYHLGDEAALGGLYALRVPMDAIEPRIRGYARPGDAATIHISGNLVAEVLVGDYGETERLDIDPAFLSGDSPALGIDGQSVVEVDSGTVPLDFNIDLSMPAVNDVQVGWATEDGTAVGGVSCTTDVDYVTDSGVATILTGQTQTMIQVQVCGDFLIEPTEEVIVRLSNPVNAVIQFETGAGRILDDDGQPELSVRDLVVSEPVSGNQSHSFEVRLSRPSDQVVSFDYLTLDGTATVGSDYLAVRGNLVVPVGETRILVPITVNSDGVSEGPETFFLEVSNASQAVVIDDQGMAIILDSDSNRETTLRQQLDHLSPGMAGMISPTDIVFSPGGEHAYVSALVTGSILHFDFIAGALGIRENIDPATSGFSTGLFAGIRQIAMTPDGRFLYAAASEDHGVMGMARNTLDGRLSFLESVVDNAVLGISGLGGATGIAISGDGVHLYLAGRVSNTLAVFSIDAANGTLTFVEVEVNGVDDSSDTGGAVSRMDGPMRVVVSPDGNQVYVAADRSSGVTVFDRDSATGALSFKVSYQNGVAGVAGIGGAAALAVPVDGKQLYVLGGATDTIARFNRLVDGSLGYVQHYTQTNGDFVGLENPVEISISADGSRVYAVGIDDSSLVTMKRETNSASPNFGNLTFGDVVIDDSNVVTDMAGPTSVTMSPDSQYIVVTAGIDNAVVVFYGPNSPMVFANGFELLD